VLNTVFGRLKKGLTPILDEIEDAAIRDSHRLRNKGLPLIKTTKNRRIENMKTKIPWNMI